MKEQKGEAVFTDVDEVLAGKIVRHATESSAPPQDEPQTPPPPAVNNGIDLRVVKIGVLIGMIAGIFFLARIFRRR